MKAIFYVLVIVLCFATFAIASEANAEELKAEHFENNWCPTVSAGADQVVNSGQRVYINGQVNDQDGDQVATTWSTTRGSFVNKRSLSTQFIAPKVTRDTYITITLIGTDNKGGTGSDKASIKVLAYGPTPTPTDCPCPPTPTPTLTPTPTPTQYYNNPPVVTISGTTVVNSGDLVYASVSAYDPDGDVLYYFWERSEGAITVSNDGLSVTVTSPNHIANMQYMSVWVRVSDNRGGETTQTLLVQVVPIGDAGSANKNTTIKAPTSTAVSPVLNTKNDHPTNTPKPIQGGFSPPINIPSINKINVGGKPMAALK